MGTLVNQVRSLFAPSGWGQGDRLLSQLFREPSSPAGVRVDVDTAQSLSVVWACTALLSSTIAALPIFAYRRQPDGSRERDPRDPAADLLTHSPNPWQTSYAFREAMVRCLLLYGNAFSLVTRDAGGRPRELGLLHPMSVQIVVDEQGVRYRVTLANGRQEMFPPYQILHVVGYSFDGLNGLSVISAARRALGLGIALEEFGSSFFSHGSTFGGILSHPALLTPDNEKRLRESLEKRHQGVDRAHQFVILQGGMKFEPLGIPADEAQLVESSKLSTATIARWFGCPPSLVNAESGASSMRYSNSEQESISFLTFGLLPWLRRLEGAYNRSLVSSLERFQSYLEHKTDALLRPDSAARWAAYRIALDTGVMTVQEVRALENLS